MYCMYSMEYSFTIIAHDVEMVVVDPFVAYPLALWSGLGGYFSAVYFLKTTQSDYQNYESDIKT